MDTGSYFKFLLLLLLLGHLVSGCATIIEGSTDRVRYDGGPGRLAFYDRDGKQIPSEYEYDEIYRIHLNYIELDKRVPEHVITARSGNMIQQDTLRRRFSYGWLIPDALLIYPFPAFAGVDILTGSIYSFTPRRSHLAVKDSIDLPEPVIMSLQSVVDRRLESQKIMLAAHTGVMTPFQGSQQLPPSYGASVGYNLGKQLWSTVGYNYSTDLEQHIGQLGRAYATTVHNVEASLQYAPTKYLYGVAGLGFNHLIYELASNREDESKRFGRNVMTGNFGIGATFGGLFFELRRNVALARIETPEGPGHYVQYTHLRFGAAVRFSAI
jgi:hypothetical protein